MNFQRINLSTAERVFQMVYNVAGATVTANYPVCWDQASTCDGVRVTRPIAANLSLLVGIATADIVDSAYGRVQCYGYRSSAFVTTDTSQAVNNGDILIPVTAVYHLARSAASDGKSGFLYAVGGSGTIAFATMTTPVAANKPVLIRCL
jgi:hypothetical protein